MTKPTGNKRGRPSMPASERKRQVCTTISAEAAIIIVSNNWKLNEIIMEGIDHRLDCSRIGKNMIKAGMRIAELEEEIEALKAIICGLKTTGGTV